MDDAAIIDLYWARDSRAIDETGFKYGSYLTRVAMNLLGIPEDAEECVSDTYLAAWNAMPPERPGILRAFLGRITRNLALDRIKRLRAKKRGGGEAEIIFDELSEIIPGGDRPEAELDRKELLRDIEDFLRSEPERSRNMFLRRYWYADSVGAIASRYGVRENAVSAQLLRTRNKLRKYLTGRGYVI